MDLALGHDQVRRAWGGEAVAGRRRKLGRLLSGAAPGPGVGAAGKTPEGLRPRLAELPASPWAPGGAPLLPPQDSREQVRVGRQLANPTGVGAGAVVPAKDATGQPPAVPRAVTGTDSNPLSSSFTLFCVRRVARAKEKKRFHLPCPGSVTAKFCRAVCFNFSGSI